MFKNVAIEMKYPPLFHESLSILTSRLQEIIIFKTLNFKVSYQHLLVLTLFQMADNPPRLILVFAGRTLTLLVLSCRGSCDKTFKPFKPH